MKLEVPSWETEATNFHIGEKGPILTCQYGIFSYEYVEEVQFEGHVFICTLWLYKLIPTNHLYNFTLENKSYKGFIPVCMIWAIKPDT